MQQFTYVVQDPLGIHARPAGQLAKLVKEHEDTVVTIAKGPKAVKATQLMKLMSLAVKKGDEIVVTVEGPAEETAAAELKKFFEENL